MNGTKPLDEVKQQLTDLLSRLAEGIAKQIIQSEKDIEGFVRIMPDMERELLGLQGVKTGSSLLEILGYSLSDVEDHPTKKVVVGQISYSPDYVLKCDGQILAVLDLKAPDVDLDHPKWLGQISSYCMHLAAPLGVLFNGQSIYVYINTGMKGLTQYKDLFASRPVAEASSKNPGQLRDTLLAFSAASLTGKPLKVAQSLAAKRKNIEAGQKKKKQICECIRVALVDPSHDVLAALALVDDVWGAIGFKPSKAEVVSAWEADKQMPLTVTKIEATAKQSINSIVRQKVVEVCALKGWNYLADAKIKGLRYRDVGGNGYYPVPKSTGVPENLYVAGLSTANAKQVIQQLEFLLHH